MVYVLLAVLCFVFSYSGFFIGAEQSDAEKSLQAKPAAGWAMLAAGLGELDYIVFTAVAISDQSVYRAAAVSFLPTVIGAGLGEYRSVIKNYVRERIKDAERAARRAAKKAEVAKTADQ